MMRSTARSRLRGAAVAVLMAVLVAPAATNAAEAVEVGVSGGTLTIRARSATVGEVLHRIAVVLNARLLTAGDLPAGAREWNLRDVPVAEAVLQVARPMSVLLMLERDGAGDGTHVVREIHVATGAGDGAIRAAALPAESVAERVRELARVLGGDADPGIRRSAAADLGGLGMDAGIRALDRALGDSDRGVRIAAIEALGQIGTNEVARLLGQIAMGSGDPEVEAAAIAGLERMTTDTARSMLAMVRARAGAAGTRRP